MRTTVVMGVGKQERNICMED